MDSFPWLLNQLLEEKLPLLAESELREEFTTAFILFETYRAKGVEALFTRLGEEAVIGAVFASFLSQ